jgi:hypothetical protein
VNVAGRKKTVIAAMIRINALSRDVAIATSYEILERSVLVAARPRLCAESRCAMALYNCYILLDQIELLRFLIFVDAGNEGRAIPSYCLNQSLSPLGQVLCSV